MKVLRTALHIFLIITLLAGAYVGGNLLYGTITDYEPPKKIELNVHREVKAKPDSIFSLMTWNIGYAGLGEESDFFYDGGETVRMSNDVVIKNLAGITNFIAQNDSMDFLLLQEVDTMAKRSYYIDELAQISADLPNHAYSFAKNYKVNFVPVPYLNPMGKVVAGVASYSRFQPNQATRYGFDANFSWPTSIYFLDRCFLLHRVPLQNGKELLVLNTHNSAYDDTGELKAKELGFIKSFVTAEYDKGNYVIIGGDWNQCPPDFDITTFSTNIPEGYDPQNIEADFFPEGWQFIYDSAVATNRDLKAPYRDGSTFTTLIDYFLVSPNLEVLSKKGIDMNFEFSDHQPVLMTVKLN